MKAKRGLAALALLASAFSLSACASHEVKGTIEWAVRDRNVTIIQIEDHEIIYKCSVYKFPICDYLERGNEIVMQIGYYDAKIESIDLIKEAAPTPSN